MRALALSLALTSLALPQPVIADNTAETDDTYSTKSTWKSVNSQTGAIRDLEGLTELAQAFPNSSSVRLRLLNAQLQAGEMEALLENLRWLNERGYVFGEVAQTQIPKLVGEDYSDRARTLLIEAPSQLDRSDIAWTVPAEAGLVESVFVYPAIDGVAVSSVSGRAIWGKLGSAEWDYVALNQAGNLSGLAGFVDTGELWVASGNIDQSDDEESYFSGLFGSVPGRDEPRVPAPEGVTLSDLHAASDGTIYASDPLAGGIYKLGPAREAIEELVAPGTFRSPQGLATSEDHSRLYVSDYRYGIAIIDLKNGEVSHLDSDVPAILDGTDALFRRGNSLIAIQNGTSPMRISQFVLSNDGMRVIEVRTLEQAHSEWTEPLSGHLGDDALYYVGNGQWDKYVAGELGEGKEPEPTQIRRLPLD